MTLTGKVQGVGFRPFVYRLANQYKLNGSVTNDGLGVTIVIEGKDSAAKGFMEALPQQLPSLARIDTCHTSKSTVLGEKEFRIIPSQYTHTYFSELPTDLAICKNCTHELFDPANRRYLSPFINCIDCGPRYSSITSLPYDRKNTSLNKFPECDACIEEHNQSHDRRFHAQGLSCHDCGPQYSLVDGNNQNLAENAIEAAATLIKMGKIIAIKGLSGFHLVCDANNDNAVDKLRQRKHRPDKPFAIMALNAASLSQWVKLNDASCKILQSPSAPIVLLPKHDLEYGHNIAPKIGDIACTLPYAPIYLLLFYYLKGQPSGHKWLSEQSTLKLVVTSANKSGDAIHYDNELCINDLKKIADCFLLHNRDIAFNCDDSVIQSGSPPIMVRRARGYAPLSLDIKSDQNSSPDTVVGFGAHLKNTFCLSLHNKALLSPHIGELSTPSQQSRFDTVMNKYLSLLKLLPKTIACDYHKDYTSTIKAEQLSKQEQIPLQTIQHHHAHFAAAMAENKSTPSEAAIGLILDGTGLGTDNQLWGGELLYYHDRDFKRIAHFETLALPGGDKASKEIWRIGAALINKIAPQQVNSIYKKHLNTELVRQFICHGNHILTSSTGRWFDAAASILEIRQSCSYEAQAAMELEALASQQDLPPPLGLVKLRDNQLIISELSKHLMFATSKREGAAMFHSELIDGLKRWLLHWSSKLGCKNVYASGGCFQNRILREGLYRALRQHDIFVNYQKLTPINDGGISLGQAWIVQNQSRENQSKENH